MVWWRLAVQVAVLFLAVLAALVSGGSQAGGGVAGTRVNASVIWTTPTLKPQTNKNGEPVFADTMPLGNGNAVAQVWTNATAGTFNAILGRADAMAGTTEIFKLGWLQIRADPSPFGGANCTQASCHVFFNQTLDPATATVTTVVGGDSIHNYFLRAVSYVDANNHVFRTAFDVGPAGPQSGVSLSVSVLSLRPEQPFNATPPFHCEPWIYPPDVLFNDTGNLPRNALGIYHRNNDSVVKRVLKQQSLTHLENVTTDWWLHRQFGFLVAPSTTQHPNPSSSSSSSSSLLYSPDSWQPGASSSQIRTTLPVLRAELVAALLSNQTRDETTWIHQAADALQSALGASAATTRAQHEAWWANFWSRSHVVIANMGRKL